MVISLSKNFKRLGMSWQKLAREMIKDKIYAPNAPSTVAAWYARGSETTRKKASKRASKQGISISESLMFGKTPLIDDGDLVKSIGYDVDVVETLGGGMTLTLGANKKVDGRNVAAELHEGATRREGGRTIVIPARPYIRTPIESEEFGNQFKQAVNEALKEAFSG